MPDKQHIIKNRIHDYLEDSLLPDEVDELWAGLLGDEEEFEYLETLALLRKMGAEGQFDDLGAGGNILPHRNRIQRRLAAPYFRVAAAIAAVLLLTILTIYQTGYPGSGATLSPVASIDYGVERSGEIGDHMERIKNHIIGMTNSSETEDVIFYVHDQLSNGSFTDQEVYELHILKGSIYYNSGMYKEAKRVFQEGTERGDPETDIANYEKNLWYLANSHLQLGEKDQAIECMKEVILLDGSFARVAGNLLSAVGK